MTGESIRVLIASGFFMLLLFLRLESDRFGAAEYDEPTSRRGFWTRLSWYLIGLALLGAIYVVHPQPHDVLLLLVGHRSEAVAYGALLAVLGTALVVAFAWFRYGELRLPPARAYPGAALNAIGTAVIDEGTFRGALLGTLVAIGLNAEGSIVVAALAYVLTTRLAAPGRHRFMMLLALVLGLLGGWATLATGGIGAAIIGHSVTSFALFVCTGHAGQVAPVGLEPEEIQSRRQMPPGWQDARRPTTPGRGAEPRGLAGLERSGYGDRIAVKPARGGVGHALSVLADRIGSIGGGAGTRTTRRRDR
jgi:hypothetical protein